ncbi:DUF6477 family protein [Defluviimonas aestuarii]|uniref:DUF6477 family protein n=1 Tax=Albidovulum aestuarii TaxID=1130726 RepID=UPI00249C1A4B|nr:DUF6477 family protein [Defluviimonas aestuarii]MDI3337346.1 DUF6477 family protein [Defluviimonas aestuarii]
MSDLPSMLQELRRPRLLIRAARAGLAEYNRNRDLKRLVRANAVPDPDRALSILMEEEERIEATRRTGDASYSFTRHIEVLIAMMAEVRLLRSCA